MNFKRVRYEKEEILLFPVEDYNKYVLFERARFHVVKSVSVNSHTTSVIGREFTENLIENAKHAVKDTIYNTTINVLFRNIFTKMFYNKDGKIYSIDVMADTLEGDAYKSYIDNIKMMISENKELFDESVDIMFGFNLAINK